MKILQRLTSFLLALVLVILIVPANDVQAQEGEEADYLLESEALNSWRYSDGELIPSISLYAEGEFTEYTTFPENVKGAVAKGIDVSHHQGQIDWEKVKAAGVDYAIIRCGYGDDDPNQDDKYWEYNVNECIRLGIPFGAYIYSYATTVEMAASEADHVLRLAEGYEFDYPIYFDMEADVAAALPAEQLGAIAKTFCDKIEAAGYEVGIYANKYWFTSLLTDPVFDQWPKWCAQYAEKCTYAGEYTMWQCSSKGQIDGINGNVDLNIDFGSAVKSYTEYRVIDEYVNYRTGPGTSYDLVGRLMENRVIKVEDGYSKTANGHTWYRFVLNGQEYYVASSYLKKASEASVTMSFSDVKENTWFYAPVKYVYENGYMVGTSKSEFGPLTTLSRSQFVTILYRLAGCPYTKTTKSFPDVKKNTWYTDAVLWGAEKDIVAGYPNGKFGTEDPLSREQMVALMYRYAKYMGVDVSEQGSLDKFTDKSEVSTYALEAVKWAVGTGLISGKNDGTKLAPQDSMTRAECATVITQFMQK